jgi:hypothetical protein
MGTGTGWVDAGFGYAVDGCYRLVDVEFGSNLTIILTEVGIITIGVTGDNTTYADMVTST